MKIPFNKPFMVGKELYYIAQSVISGHTAGDGQYTRLCTRALEERFRAKKVLLTTSCTSALEMAAILCNVGPGDEVILPSYTFVSTANAFLLRGATLRFVDVQEDTLNIDVEKVGEIAGEKTKVIVPVHYGGVGCEMDEIVEIANSVSAYVVEDAAQGFDAQYKGRPLGTIGDIGTLSFHETKNLTCGEGGAIIVNNESLMERAEIIREKGTNRSQFFRGEVDKYTWVDLGSSYLSSDILAAFLYAQLERADDIYERRVTIFEGYLRRLGKLEEEGHVRLPRHPTHCRINGHLFYLVAGSEEIRDELMAFLKEREILAVFHYLPLHLSPVGRSLGYREGMFPVTEDVSGRLLRLPFYFEITERELDRVSEAIYEFFGVRPG